MGSITYNYDFPVDRKDPVGIDRRRSLSRLVPSLFTERFRSVLYVGANWFGTAFLLEFKRAGYDVTIVEPFPRNCESLTKEHGDLFDSMEQCLVEDFKPLDGRKYDVIFWWHGPEHVEEERLPDILKYIEGLANYLVILGCPWGRYKMGANYGNPYERHRAYLYPEKFIDLGYTRIECLGEVDTPGSNITSVKILNKEAGRMDGERFRG